MSNAGFPSFTEAEHATLVECLETDRDQGLGYPETAGFLFALICAPQMVMPSEWIGGVLGEREIASHKEAEKVLGALMSLNDWIASRREAGESPLPPGVELASEPMENFAADAAISRWSRGFLGGHSLVADDWEAHVPDDSETGLALAVLGFFSSKKFAESFCEDIGDEPLTVEEFSETVYHLMPDSFIIYAAAGRAAQERVHQSSHEPVRSEKVGRNEPCPCGSGKKYKKCCGLTH
jgi:uncharacterized protein